MRLLRQIALRIALAIFIAGANAKPILADDLPSKHASGGSGGETLSLGDSFSQFESYFYQRFADATATRRVAAAAKRSPAAAPENWAAGETPGHFEALSVHYASDGLELAAGNYAPTFGVSAALAPLSLAAGLSREHEQKGRLGIGAAWHFPGAGEHRLSLGSYFAESRLLSAAGSEGENLLAGGEPYVTELRHLSAALDGQVTPLEGLSYQLALRYQEWGEESVVREYGYIAALYGDVSPFEGIEIHPIVEIAGLEDSGDAALNRHFLTLGLSGDHGPWNLSLTYSGRETRIGDEPETLDEDRLLHLSLRHSSEDGTTAEIGHRIDSTNGVDIISNLNIRLFWPF
jgi:hypothetical protein